MTHKGSRQWVRPKVWPSSWIASLAIRSQIQISIRIQPVGFRTQAKKGNDRPFPGYLGLAE